MPDDRVRVVLLGLPVALHQRSAEHVDDLRREFELIRRADPDAHRGSAPERLHALIDALSAAYQGSTDQPNAQLQEAVARSQQSINLVYLVPAEAAGSLAQLSTMLDEADEYCRTGGHLLTMAAEPEVLRYRRWFFDQCLAQLGGAAPTPWVERRRVADQDGAGRGVAGEGAGTGGRHRPAPRQRSEHGGGSQPN